MDKFIPCMSLVNYGDCFGGLKVISPSKDQEKEGSPHPYSHKMLLMHNMTFPVRKN